MVVLPRHRRYQRGPPPQRNPYGSPDEYAPHGYPHALAPRSRLWNQQSIILLIAGMGIGYLILPVLVVNNQQGVQNVGLHDVVKNLERKRSMMNGNGNNGIDNTASPMNMMHNSQQNAAAAMLRRADSTAANGIGVDVSGGVVASTVDSRRRASADGGAVGGDEFFEVAEQDGEGHVIPGRDAFMDVDIPGGGNVEHLIPGNQAKKEVFDDADFNQEHMIRENQEQLKQPEHQAEQPAEAQQSQSHPQSQAQPQAPPLAINTQTNPQPAIPSLAEADVTETQKLFLSTQKLLATQSIPTSTTPYIMTTPTLPDSLRKRIMITGGAGFVGSHLVDKLMMEGHEVIVVDNFFTGQRKNIEHWMHHPRFSLVVHDVTEPIMMEVDEIYHLACPASPPHYQYNPVKTIKTSTMGTINMLGLAKRVKAKILLTSTSEIYGDPEVHPQPESYWGNVNTIGPRSCYDEGKRVAETMMYSYHNQNNVDVRVARIFNTFGPRMHPNDGRVVSNFIIQSLQDKPMTIYGDGSQTRSFQYVSDLVAGLHALMNGSYVLPVNLGNPDEYKVKDFAEYIKDITGSKSEITFLKATKDDPTQRKPDITTAKRELDWEPKITVREGLEKTIAYFGRVLEESGEIIPTGQEASKPKPKIQDLAL
mmetsp:Transcript_13629/g.29098  ORF Transcript_13629/g.29098 Transcript_13629/m.29098 type:complete len:648 (+) Transcript_13629:113-2056(+)